jgi:hypothetical protein
VKAAEREERHIRGADLRQLVKQMVIVPVNEIVVVLDANHVGNAPTLGDLCGCNVAEAQMLDEPFTLQIRQGLELGSDGPLYRPLLISHAAEVHHIQALDAKVAKIIMNGLYKLRGTGRRIP